MRLRAAILTVLGFLALAGAANSADADQCLNGLGPALEAGGFAGSLDCKHDRLFVRHVGRVQKFGRTFQIYSYRYRLKPACPDCAIHGGQRIIFMDGGRYVGQYKLDFVQVTIRQGDLVLVPLDPDSGGPVKVRFTSDGPPGELLVDGELIGFFR